MHKSFYDQRLRHVYSIHNILGRQIFGFVGKIFKKYGAETVSFYRIVRKSEISINR